MSMSFGSKLQLEPGSWLEAVYDVVMGIVVGARHSIYLLAKTLYGACFRPVLRKLGIIQPPEIPVTKEETLKVVGVGYGRTGTYSLTLALEELGYPTLHTQHLYENEDIISMWNNDIFAPSIHAKEVKMGRPDLQLIANKFQATTDLPMALYFEQVMEEYPDCKFILTTRENSEVWFRSWNTLANSIARPASFTSELLTTARQYSNYLRWLFSVVNQDGKFLTAPFPFPEQNKEASIASYEEHNRRVRQIIPADRLLEYSVKDGWDPLCSFLEIADCPQTPFPKTNSARAVQVQSISAFMAPLIIVLFVLFFGFAALFQRLTGKTVMQWARYKSRELMLALRKVLIGGDAKAWEQPPNNPRKMRKIS